MVTERTKLGHLADAEAAERSDDEALSARRWWRLVPAVLTHPQAVFEEIREGDDDDRLARQEPLLAIVTLSGIAGSIISPVWSRMLDQNGVDGVALLFGTFVVGGLAGFLQFFLLGWAVWAGARAVGSLERAVVARHVVGWSAIPVALSLAVTAPLILVAYGGDFFRAGGSDEGAGRWLVIGLGLGFVAWSLALLVVGLRTTFRLPWRGVFGAALLAAGIVGALAIFPGVV